jgi:hypothetical protein
VTGFPYKLDFIFSYNGKMMYNACLSCTNMTYKYSLNLIRGPLVKLFSINLIILKAKGRVMNSILVFQTTMAVKLLVSAMNGCHGT